MKRGSRIAREPRSFVSSANRRHIEQTPKPVIIKSWHVPAAQLGVPPSSLQSERQVPVLPPEAGTTHCEPRMQNIELLHAPPFATVPDGTQSGPFGDTTHASFAVHGIWVFGSQVVTGEQTRWSSFDTDVALVAKRMPKLHCEPMPQGKVRPSEMPQYRRQVGAGCP